MPSYPDSVKSFTAKSAAQTIGAAHVNDLQDEVNAIEAGLLNGTAPLNSSNSTVAALSVTGGSTFAGTLQSSNSTVNSLQVSSNSTFALRPTMPPPDAVRVTLNANLDLANNTDVKVNWSTAVFATNSSLHSTAANSSRLSPQSTGVYVAHAIVFPGSVFAASTANIEASLLDSSNGSLGRGRVFGVSDVQPILEVTGLKRFDVVSTASYVLLAVRVRSGTTNSLDNSGTFLEFYKL